MSILVGIVINIIPATSSAGDAQNRTTGAKIAAPSIPKLNAPNPKFEADAPLNPNPIASVTGIIIIGLKNVPMFVHLSSPLADIQLICASCIDIGMNVRNEI